MRKIREVLRLRLQCKLTERQIAQSCKIGLGTVYEYARRARDAGLSWPLPEGITDDELDRRLFPPPLAIPSELRPQPDWPTLSRELSKKGVTLLLLWYEYRAVHPDGYGYSRFCELYHRWASESHPRMRCVHKAGEKLFVDYAGQTMPVVDPKTGDIHDAQIFVATLGASSCTYVEATASQTLPDWISSHVRAFAHLGGVPEIVVPGNLKGGVTKPCAYDPELNVTYQEMARHYGIAIIPTRVRAPRDKAKVESGVLQVERWVLAPLRHRRFFSLAELNAAMRPLVEQLNARAASGQPASRRELFQQLDQPALKPLPAQPYELALWNKVRITHQTIELFHHSTRVASHVRSYKVGGFTTLPEHMPPNHRQWGDWSPQRIVRWAEKTGPATAQVAREIMAARPHPYQGYRSCLGILRLGNEFGADRLEAACACALSIRALTYKSVKSILVHRLDRAAPPQAPAARPPIDHPNIRGAAYYQSAPTQRSLTDAALKEPLAPAVR